MDSRTCKICQVDKKINKYRPDKISPQGRLYTTKTCEDCKREQQKLNTSKCRKRNPEKHRARQRESSKKRYATPEGKEKMLKWCQESYQRRKEKVSITSKEHYIKNRKEIRQQQALKYNDMKENNPEKYNQRRKAQDQYRVQEYKNSPLYLISIDKRRKITVDLTDSYIKSVLVSQDGWARKDLTPGMIECKRISILTYRELNPNYSLNRKKIEI